MIPEEFKIKWITGILDTWTEFDIQEIEKAPINYLTKDFLKVGFPQDAAPFLDFGWQSYKGKFVNVSEYYTKFKLDISAKNYWIFGSDGGGNLICFDISQNDKIVLLDHEQAFELIAVINTNIKEFAECLLLYKRFMETHKKTIEAEQLGILKDSFKTIDADIFKKSDFWRSEINALNR